MEVNAFMKNRRVPVMQEKNIEHYFFATVAPVMQEEKH